jgi:hypothetical protein
MAARFISDPEIGAGPSPFDSMRRYATAPDPGLCEQVSQLVAEGTIDLHRSMFGQSTVQQDATGPDLCAASGRTQPGRPFDAHFAGKRWHVVGRK